MKLRDPELLLQHAPFLRQVMTTPAVMRDVLLALAPATLAAVWYFGASALLVLSSSIVGAVLVEWTFAPRELRSRILLDGSGFVTGLLLGLTLPPGLPMWMAFLGGAVGIGLGKLIWGGLGHNLFNPALVGRAFLLATFPTAMTTWSGITDSVWRVRPANLSIPFTFNHVDGVSAATPLGLMKFESKETPLSSLILGNTSGSLGETSGILLLLGGIYLIMRRDLDWKIPVAILIAAMAFSGILDFIDPARYPGPLVSVFSGGMLLGAIYMATDPVTSPSTPLGTWIFGFAIGLLVILIRVFGGLPEGVMYSILLMNAATPLIERLTQPRVFGHVKSSGQ
jgi:electron transport complex protein RnfD